jgi:hypothetical protein
MSKSTNKIKNAIISYLSSLKTSNVHPDLKFYLDFYTNIFSEDHFEKLAKLFFNNKNYIQDKNIKICKTDPLFVSTAEYINIVNYDEIPLRIIKCFKKTNQIDIFWEYYKIFLKISIEYLIEKNYYKSLADNQGFLITL